MSETAATLAVNKDSPKNLDDVMLAMDIVDTLRHREQLIDRELSAEHREEKLLWRLREIYAAQGIDVPDRILRDGVKALEEKRFVYEPPKNSFAVSLAKFYISRDRWLKPAGAILGFALFATALYEFGYERPRHAVAEQSRIEITQTIPANLAQARDAALTAAESGEARIYIETIYQDGNFAVESGNVSGARSAINELSATEQLLKQDLSIRVVSRPNEMSGVFRIHDDNPGVKNYYLIVEAVDARGRAQQLSMASEEDQRRKAVSKWGVRVPEDVFNRVAADKRDDQIIQDSVVGAKPKGILTPEYTIETAGGTILEW